MWSPRSAPLRPQARGSDTEDRLRRVSRWTDGLEVGVGEEDGGGDGDEDILRLVGEWEVIGAGHVKVVAAK